MILDFTYDEFTGTKLNAAWLARNSAGQALTTWELINGLLRVTMPSGDPTGLGCYFWLDQPRDDGDLLVVPEDMYCKFKFPGTLPEAPSWGYIVFITLWDEDEEGLYDGDLGVQFTWDNATGSYQWSAYGWSDWNEYGEYAEATPVPVGNPTECWLRLRTPTGEVSKIYYSLTEPEYDTDWTEVIIPGNNYRMPAGRLGEISLAIQGDCEDLLSDTDFYLDFVRPWVGKTPGARCRSRQINFSKTAPTKVEDMKDGEMMIEGDRIFGRVGNQILSVDMGIYLPTTTTTTTTTTT